MKCRVGFGIVAVVVSVILLGLAGSAAAQESGAEIWLMGGIQALNENDTAFPDDFLNIPAVVSAAYPLSSLFAVEGEFTWMIPIEQGVDVGSGVEQDRKTPDVLAYQASLRANFGSGSWRPYVVAGAGAATFLSNTDANRLPAIDESETAFAINFGTGLTYALTPRWSLRADFREFVAFPSDDSGLSAAGEADEVWMERGTVGVGYRF